MALEEIYMYIAYEALKVLAYKNLHNLIIITATKRKEEVTWGDNSPHNSMVLQKSGLSY
jgi:hypothetical protein